MTSDQTLPQSGGERRQSQELSQQRTRPPAHVPGYDPLEFLGVGAYGEVWVAIDKNTGRRVAIKFYSHQGGLDWSLLTREVEKLRFLFSDRYVVQLVAVGWDAKPPYYVMEYLERGSLAAHITRNGSLPVAEAVALFHDVAVGLVHAHGKGVLHCDLKPGNVLLDQDGKPRLADFGQSRLSHEQIPSLGTLFYMAPEQADLQAVPDARWDVYALGALLYTMLTGEPPHRSRESVLELERPSGLDHRLARYREMIESAPRPTGHRRVRGVDRALQEILDRCLATDPNRRFANVQAVLDALDQRELRRSYRPLVVLGAIGPMVLLLVVALFAWQGFEATFRDSNAALTTRALEGNEFAAKFVAATAASELDRRYLAVEQAARSAELAGHIRDLTGQAALAPVLEKLADPRLAADDENLAPDVLAEREKLQTALREHEARGVLQDWLSKHEPDVKVASWFVTDARGVQIARWPAPKGPTIGKNYAWRTYFHGGEKDLPPSETDALDRHITETHLSAVFRSQASENWIVAVSAPVTSEGDFLGVVALTVEMGRFAEMRGGNGGGEFAVLVDSRPEAGGLILQHRLYTELLRKPGSKFLDGFRKYRLPHDALAAPDVNYRDPLAADPLGKAYDKQWLAAKAPVEVRGASTGLSVIVQESYEETIGQALGDLKYKVMWRGVAMLGLVIVVLTVMWALVLRMINESPRALGVAFADGDAPLPEEETPTFAPPVGGPSDDSAGEVSDVSLKSKVDGD